MEYQKLNMGAIGRKLGNSITTAGKVLPGAVNNTSVSGVTALPAGIDAGSMVLLSTQTASASASIEFTSGITSTYKEYMFVFNNIHPSQNTGFRFNLSTDGGSNYNVTKTTTAFVAYHDEADSEAYLSYRTSDDLAQSTGVQGMDMAIDGVSNDGCLSGHIQLFNPSDTTYVKHFIVRTSSVKDAFGAVDYNVAGYANTTSAINAIQFTMGTGNIDDGTIQMFGVN